MGFEKDLPSIDTQLTNSPLTECDASLTDYSDFEFVFVHIDDPPKVEVKRNHIIEAVNNAELNSVLVSIDETEDKTTLFYVTENSSVAYTGNFGDGIHTLVDILLCEDWFVLTAETDVVPESVAHFFSEMTVLSDGFAEEGELFTQTYGKNQLKHRIYSIKESDTDLFGEEEPAES